MDIFIIFLTRYDHLLSDATPKQINEIIIEKTRIDIDEDIDEEMFFIIKIDCFLLHAIYN